jgi:putative flavoprotein involved in K+ transport
MTRATVHSDVVVVGGGQAGLAIGYHLAQQDRNFAILEAAGQSAAAWRARWDSLRLFTPTRYDSLPGKPFPGDPDGYPGRDEVVDYLTDYAEEFDLPVELSSPVRSVKPGDDGYLVETEGRTYEAAQVVIATGAFQVPRVPAIAGGLDDAVVSFHSSDYRTPDAIPPGPVLVVGGGNTGFQIAEELSAEHEVHLSIGSRQAPLPQKILGFDAFRFLDASGLIYKTRDSRLGKRMVGSETLVGYSPRKLRRRHGVTTRPRATAASGTTVSFEDGTSLEVSSVIWATGFGLDHAFVKAPVFDSNGQVMHRRGVTNAPGLYFLGLPWLHTRGSALLGFVKDDAQYLAERIYAYSSDTTPAPPAPAAAAAAATPFPTGERA